ncbi:MAG: hypothetical protein IK145_05165 [Bacteroidales bacterium]|nr:hypothetical protein [Bacteroidales bacterium]
MKDNKHIIKVLITKPMTDERLYDLLKKCARESAGSILKMIDVSANYHGKTQSPLADKLVNFIFHYKGGILSPNKWGYYEPVRTMVDPNTEELLKEKISRPTLIFLKKTRTPQVYISISSEFPDLKPRRDLTDQSEWTEICFYPDARRKFVLEEWFTILQDLCREMETDYGYIQNMDSDEVLAHVFSVPYLGQMKREEDELLGIRRMLEVVRRFGESRSPTLGWPSRLFYPLFWIKDKECKDMFKLDQIRVGLYALDLLRETLSVLDKHNYYYGLRLNLDRTIRDISGIRWDDPKLYWDSHVFLSRQDLRETFHYPSDEETYRIHQLPKDLSPLFSQFDRIYFKERCNEVLLIP